MANNFFSRVLFYIQRRSHNVLLRDIECSLLRLGLPKGKLKNDLRTLEISKTEDVVYNDLKKDGFSDLGITVSPGQIDSIINELSKLDCYNFGKPGTPVVNINDAAGDVQLAHYKRDDLAKIIPILQFANDSKILNTVTRYFGVRPTISNINCWWSFGDRTAPKDAQFYHRDLDDYKFLKMFIYLTDVGEDSGPHIYVKGSHRSNRLNELRRFTDEEVNEAYDNTSIAVLVKPRGNTFIEDTYGIHKGQLPLKGKRLILQIQYSYFPLHVENYQPQNTISTALNFDKYINRLLFK